MSKRYDHWFWNSKLVDNIASFIVRLDTYIWRKQYNR